MFVGYRMVIRRPPRESVEEGVPPAGGQEGGGAMLSARIRLGVRLSATCQSSTRTVSSPRAQDLPGHIAKMTKQPLRLLTEHLPQITFGISGRTKWGYPCVLAHLAVCLTL